MESKCYRSTLSHIFLEVNVLVKLNIFNLKCNKVSSVNCPISDNNLFSKIYSDFEIEKKVGGTEVCSFCSQVGRLSNEDMTNPESLPTSVTEKVILI